MGEAWGEMENDELDRIGWRKPKRMDDSGLRKIQIDLRGLAGRLLGYNPSRKTRANLEGFKMN